MSELQRPDGRDFRLLKGPERDGNVIPLYTQRKMFIVEGEDGLTHLVPQVVENPEPAKVLPYVGRRSAEMSDKVPPGTIISTGPFVARPPYELLGRAGLEERIFEADYENPQIGHEGRGYPRNPDDVA